MEGNSVFCVILQVSLTYQSLKVLLAIDIGLVSLLLLSVYFTFVPAKLAVI